VVELTRKQGRNVVIGALAALASYALFHLVTVFPLSWIQLYDTRSISRLPARPDVGRRCGWRLRPDFRPDRRQGRPPQHAGHLAALIAVFSAFVPMLMDGGECRPEHLHPGRLRCCWACRTARPPAP
jgi:hypothetical protein